MSKKLLMFVFAMTLSTSVYASDFTGLLSLMYFSIIIVPAMVIHLIASLHYYYKGRYQSKNFAVKHFEVAMLVIFLGLVVVAIDYYLSYSGGELQSDKLIYGLTIYSVLILIFALPFFVYHFQKLTTYHS